MSDFTNFRAVYNELTDAVSAAQHQFVSEHLQNWFLHLDDTPRISRVIAALQADQNINAFLTESGETKRGMGDATFQWPKDRDKRLGMKLLLFREIAEERLEAWRIGYEYMSTGSNINSNNQALSEQLFVPMAKELIRYLEAEDSKEDRILSLMHEAAIPASDRIVSLDHNSPAVQQVMTALEALEKEIRESNLYEDPEEKEMHLAEISAGRRILQAVKVRVAAILSVVGGPLMYMAKKFVDTGLGKAAGTTWELVVRILGSMF